MVLSSRGNVRSNNEDNAFLAGYYRQDDTVAEWEYECLTQDNMLAAVFDGMGGELHGEIASRMAAEAMYRIKEKSFSEVVEKYTVQTSEEIANYDFPNDMGTTFVALSIEKNRYHFFNLGDSRGYLWREGKLIQQTQDHNLVQKMYRDGILSKEQMTVHPDRHVVYQYLGMKEEEELILPECFESEPVQGSPGDICLLCSDGLTGMLSDSDIGNVLSSEHALWEKGRELMQQALTAGGKDNITLALVETI